MAAAGGSKTPTTICEMLLWLYGLKDKQSEKKLEEYIGTTLCTELTTKFKASNSSASTSITDVANEAKGLIEKVCNDAGKILKSIQSGQKQTSVNNGDFKDEVSKLKYPDSKNGQQLYEQFTYYLTACCWQLRFLYLRCDTTSTNGGWKECKYGQTAQDDSNECKTGGKQNHQQRCTKCSTSYTGCLQAFLTATNSDQGKNPTGNNIYTAATYDGQCPQVTQSSATPSPCKIPPMGFPKDNLPNGSSKTGNNLLTALNGSINSNTNNFPKLLGHLMTLDLLQNNASSSQSSSSSKALTVPSTWGVPHLFGFWNVFRGKWSGKNGQKSEWQQMFQAELNGNGQGGNGTQYKWKDNPGSPESLLDNLFKTYNNNNSSDHNNSSNHNGLSTLTTCNVNNKDSTCGKYFHGLLELAFQHVLDEFKQGGLFEQFMNHTTIKELAQEFHDKFKEFKQQLQSQQCITQKNCQCIAFCDDTHAFLYNNGLTFMSPNNLNRQNLQKKCSDLSKQLDVVLKDGAPLDKLTKLEKEQKFTPPEPPSPKVGDSRARSEGEPSSGTPPPAAPPVSTPTAKPVAAKPEAPKPQGAKPAATKPATTQVVKDAKGASSSSGPAPAPAAPPAPPAPTTVTDNKVTTATVPNGGGGVQRSGDSVQLQVQGDGQVTVTLSQSSNGGSSSPPPPQAASPSTPGATTTTTTTPSSTGPNGGSSTGSVSGTTGTVNIRDNHKDGVEIFKTLFGKVLDRLKTTFSAVSNIATNTSSLILKEINAHHSSLLEPPCNVKECIDWLIRVGEMDKKGWRENKKSPSSHKNGLFTRYCILCFTAGPLQKNSMALQDAIKKLTGSQRSFQFIIQNLISSLSHFIGYKDGEISSTTSYPSGIATASYHSAYSLTAQWPTCGPATGGAASGVQCSCCQGNDNKCQCSSQQSPSASCDGQCCHRCDVRVCAGIFIAMVPALHRALDGLSKRCNEKLKEDKTKKDKNGQTIKELKEIFTGLGYDGKSLSETQWSPGPGPGSNLNSAINRLNTIKDCIKDAFEDREKCYFKAIENSVLSVTTVPSSATTASCAKDCNVSHTTCSTPRTIREMLLWLMGLPYCEGYKQFVDKLQNKYKEHNKSTSSSRRDKNPEYFIHRQYSAVIFQLPVLFFTVEADVSYLRDTFCQFTGDTEHCKTGTNTQCRTGTDTHCTTGTHENCTTGTHENCTTGTHEICTTENKNCTVVRFHYNRCGRCLLRTFCAIVAVLYPVQRFLFKRCYSSEPARTVRGSAATRRTHTKQTVQDKDCCAPCPLELNDWSQLCVKGPSKDCKQGTECKDPSCCKDKKGSTACNTSTPTVIRSACQCRALYDFVCFMGFRVGATVALRGTALQVVLKECFGEQDEEAMESKSRSRSGTRSPTSNNNNTYVKLASCWRLSRCVLRSHCQKGDDKECTAVCSSLCCAPCSQDKALSPTSNTPTIRQMMLWLIGLPLTEAYKKDQDTVPTGRASQPSAVSSLSSSGYMFGTDGCVSNGVQCIPALKKLEDDNASRGRDNKKKPVKDKISYDRLFKRYYKESIVWMLVVFNAIEGGLTSVLCFLKGHAPGTGAPNCATGQPVASSVHACSKFTYEFNDPSELLREFCTYVYRVHYQLRFLLTMCSTPKADGGWSQCIYSNRGYATVTGGVCRCLKDINIPCNNSPLRHFLNSTDKKNKFKLCNDKKEHSSMGFTVRTCSSSLTGAHIATVLEALIDPIGTKSSTTFTRPLSLLAQYCVAIGQLEPSSLGDLFTVFGDVGGYSMWMTMYLYGKEGQRFSRTLSKELWSLFKCCSDKCKEECDKKNDHNCSKDSNKDCKEDCARRYHKELSKSISSLMARHKEYNTAQNSQAPNDSCNDSHRYSLSSLMCTRTTNTGASAVTSTESPVSPQSSPHCAPYMKSLSQGLYTYYCPTVPGAGDSKSFGVLQWLYDRLRQLLDGMKELKGAFERCECCKKGSTKTDSKACSQSSSSSCSDIVSCPYAHPTIYKFGFMLGEPEALKGSNKKDCQEGKNTGKKNCLSFLQQLGCVLRVPEGCQKGCNKDCEKCSVICSQQCTSVSSQDASTPCSSSPVSALYSAFECVIAIVYRIMLKKALLRVECTVEQWYTKKDCDEKQQEKDCSSQKDNENALQCQLIEAFESYVTNAMYCSYPRLICTFACQVFDNKNGNSVCDVSRVHHCPCVHRAPGPRITTRTSRTRECHCSKLKDGEQCSTAVVSNASLCISKSALTGITPVIPQYCPPVIDRYHYRVLQKKSDTEAGAQASGTSNHYSFKSALDFHVQGANCILPVPANLRSAVDWILRVCKGAIATGAIATQKDNDCADGQRGALCCDPEVAMFQCLAQEISCVLNGGQKDAEKKQCDQNQCDTLSTCNVSFTVSQCQECNAVFTCDGSSTSSNTSSSNASCAQCLLRNLAQGLRTFVGYKDMTQEVKGEVCKERNKVMKEINCMLECLRKFMCNDRSASTVPSSGCSLVAELGNALLKGRYTVRSTDLGVNLYRIVSDIARTVAGAELRKEKEYFSDLLCIFSRALQSDHKDCHSDLRCNTMKDCKKHCVTTPATNSPNTSTNNNCVPQGLSLLCDFFQGIQRFACEWNHIGKRSASKGSAAQECKKKEEQLQCCSQDCYLQNPCQCCSKLCPFPPSSDVVFNERRKAECLPWKFEGKEEKKNECPQDCPCKEPNKDCSSESKKDCSSHSCPRGFFQQLQCGLHVLGQCAQKVSELCSVSSSVSLPTAGSTAQCNTPTQKASSPYDITQYRKKLCDLIQALKKFGEHIEGCKFKGAPEGPKEPCKNVCASTCNAVSQDGDSQSNDTVPQCSVSPCSCRADPSYAVDGAKKLMEETKKGVEKEITKQMHNTILVVYAYNDSLNINTLIHGMNGAVSGTVNAFKSHLDDLKRLCQWLYRMGQLYASGLKGFVESLVSHLEHIIQVIDWITGIERMMTKFGDKDCVSNATELIDGSVLKCVPACCHRHQRGVTCEASVPTALCDQKATCANGTLTDAAPSSTETNTCVLSPSLFFDALNCRIDNLLSSYVLGPLPTGAITQNSVCSQGQNSGVSSVAPGATTTVDRSCLFRAFLERLRLLALDRYTLQLWQDESCTTNRVSSIRHWSIFRDGIVRHSDLEGIKRALCGLTQMEDYKGVQECGVRSVSDCSSSSTTGQKDSSVQCSNAPPCGTISSTLSASRIHDFHAICVIQKFSFEAPLRALQCSTEGLENIKRCLQNCEQGLQPLQKLLKESDCHSRGVTSCEDQCQQSCNKECLKTLLKDCAAILKKGATATPFSELYRTLCEFLCEPYGVFNLAQFLHTIMGPNAFSAAMFAIRELRDILCQLLKEGIISEPKGVLQCTGTVVPSSDTVCCLCRLMRRMCAIVSILNGKNALSNVKDTVSCVPCNAKGDCYSLASVTKRLQAFVHVLKREYIFAYPVVCGIESDKDCKKVCPGECDTQCCVEHNKDTSLVCSVKTSLTYRNASTSVSSPMPLLCAHCHVSSSICPECIPLLAWMFITLVPVLYPQLCYLAYQCRLYWQQDHMNGYKDSALSSLMRTFGWPTECLSDYYIGIDVQIHGRFVSWLLSREENSLRLLCDNFTEPSNASPFNTDSPLHRLYTQCLAYYRCRRSQSLTDSKSRTPVTPTTLRDILRFFVYLPFSTQFQSLQEVLRFYCSQSCVVNFSDLFATLMMSSAMSAVLLQLIECPEGEFLCFFDDIYTNREGLYLENNTETLFYQLCDLSVTLYRGLKFLSLQCGTGASLAGWRDCRLRGVKRNKEGKDTSQGLDTQQLQLCASHLCECIGAKDSSTTCSVTIPTPMCLNSQPNASTPASHTTCSLPLLRYLSDANCFFDSRRTVPSALRKVCLNDSCQEMIYRHMAPRRWEKGAVQCTHRERQQRDCDQKACSSVCFVKDCDRKCSDRSKCHPCCRAHCCVPVCSSVTGASLFLVLRNFVGHEHDADPLLQFTRYMVAIAAWPPDSLSGYMTFMLRFSDQLGKEKRDPQGSVSVSSSVAHGNTSQEKDSYSAVLSSLKSEISLFPGEFKPECLIGAFLRVTCCEHKKNGVTHTASASALASHSTDASCLSSSSQCTTSSVTIPVLRDCQQCERLLRPLDYEVYDLYLPMYARRYLTWMLHFGPRLHRGMRALEKEFRRHMEDKSVSQSAVCATDPGTSQSRTSVPCHPSVLQCPYAFPELHSAGLHFWDPNRMCNVSCQCLVDTLECSLKDSSTLAGFLRQCDSFLWSVRKPFYWLTMALWIMATVYLLFVHFWRLDSWRLLSHVIRSRASHLVYPKVLLAAEHSYERYYAQR